jgi:hypothetical protein
MENEIAFILFEFCKRYVTPSYNNYKNFCGELQQCINEIKRRFKIKIIEKSSELDSEISEYRKKECEDIIKFMKNSNIQINGDLNYILYGFCKRHVKARFYRYYDLSCRILYCEELMFCIKRLEEELLAPYEDIKIIENGDVD